MIRDQITQTLKDAMHAGNKDATSTLRMIMAAIKDKDIAARTQGTGAAIDDDQVRQLLQSMIKQRKDSIALYEQGGRPELAAKEQAEIQIIIGFLPAQMSEDEVRAAVAKTVSDLQATSIKDMGKVMGALRGGYAGRMDFGAASDFIKQALQG